MPSIHALPWCPLLEECEAQADEHEQEAECALEIFGGNLGGKPGAEVTAEDGERDDGERGAPLDIALVEMFEGTDQGGGDDDDEGSADGLFNVADGRAEEE